jgi:hypothetical protein
MSVFTSLLTLEYNDDHLTNLFVSQIVLLLYLREKHTETTASKGSTSRIHGNRALTSC